MRKNAFYLILFVIFAAGVLFRIFDISTRSLEYDEIWTVQHYFKCSFSEIFTKLETPNNHPLHTLLAKKVCSFAGTDNLYLRLTALTAGLLFIIAGALYAKRFFRSRIAVIALTALFTFTPYFVHYSRTARGYSMQFLFVFLMFTGLLEFRRKPSYKMAFAVFCSASAALFTIYSGLIFVCAAAGAYMLSFFRWQDCRNEFKKHIPLFAAGVLFFIIAALWLGMNRQDIAAAQQFGTRMTSVMQFFRSIFDVMYDLNALVPLAVIIVALILHHRDRLLRFGLVFVLLIIGSVLVTKCGPARVYMPMLGVLLFVMAHGIDVISARFRKIKKFKVCLWLAVIVLLLFNMQKEIDRISPPDWRYMVTQLERNVSAECYIVYPAGDTYPIISNYPEAALNLANRTLAPLSLIGFVSPERRAISCLAEDISEKKIKLNTPLQSNALMNGYSFELYQLEPLNAANCRQGCSIVAFFVFVPRSQYLQLRAVLYENDDCYLLNAFFNKDYSDGVNQQLRAVVLFIPRASQEFAFYAKLAESCAGRLKFYVLKSADK